MGQYQDTFLMRNHDSYMNAETPIDNLMIFRTVVFDGGGHAVVDLSDTVRDGAEVNYLVLSNTKANSVNAGTFGTAGIAINRGGVGVVVPTVIGLAADSNSEASTVPAVSKTLMVMFIIRASDLRTVNG